MLGRLLLLLGGISQQWLMLTMHLVLLLMLTVYLVLLLVLMTVHCTGYMLLQNKSSKCRRLWLWQRLLICSCRLMMAHRFPVKVHRSSPGACFGPGCCHLYCHPL